jgi:benzoate-CoA ligase
METGSVMTITDTKIYSEGWQKWKDPEVPEYFNPTEYLLDRHMESQIERKCAITCDGAKITYRELLGKVNRVANAFMSLGLEPENRVLLFGNDSIAFLSTWIGALRCGLVPVVVSDLYKKDMLLYFLKDTASKALFIDEAQLAKLEGIKDSVPSTLKHIMVHGDAKGQWHSFDELIKDKSSSFEPVPRHRNDVTYMFYSGGTTGRAKGITHLAQDFVLIPERHGAYWEYSADDICFATSKKYFTHGLWPGVLMPLYHGATSVISREPPTAENVVSTIEQDKPTALITVPTVVKNILAYVEQVDKTPDFSSLRMAISASEKMPPEIFEKWYKHFNLEIMDSIGSAEVTYEWIANRPKEFKRGSLGKPVFGVEIKLVDHDGQEVTEPNKEGEAWVKSKTACFFYWRKFDKTKETLVGEWCRTGDLLTFDEDGFFWFSGRSGDVFKVKGLWVSPIEVEAVITEEPEVLEAAVISKEDEEGLTHAKAFVVLKKGFSPSDELTERLGQSIRQQIGGYKVPKWIAYVDSLPRTTLLKIDRRTLREQEKARQS